MTGSASDRDSVKALGAAWLTSDRLICGWAWAPSTPDRRLIVEVHRDGVRLAQAVADARGESAEASAAGDGRHGFLIDVAGLIAPGAQVLEVRVQDGPVLVGGQIKVKGGAHDGEVVSPGYLEDEAALRFLETTAFEHYAYEATRMFPRRLARRLLNRLRRERNGFLDGPPGMGVKLLVLGEVAGSAAAAAWTWQSYPWTTIDRAPLDAGDFRRLVEGVQRVFLAAPDDVLHPSTAGIVLASGGKASSGIAMRRPKPWPARAAFSISVRRSIPSRRAMGLPAIRP